MRRSIILGTVPAGIDVARVPVLRWIGAARRKRKAAGSVPQADSANVTRLPWSETFGRAPRSLDAAAAPRAVVLPLGQWANDLDRTG